MNKNYFKSFFLLPALGCLIPIIFYGCATTNPDTDLEIQGIKNRLTVLQAELSSKDEQISQMRLTIDESEKEKTDLSAQIAALNNKLKPASLTGSMKQIQTALKNAGYDPGEPDGKMGSQTSNAIKAFQKDHLLPVTGKVDKATWQKLQGYLAGRLK